MLEKLVLRNFQIHEKFIVQLDPKITTFIGPSDSGKSSIIRSLKWIMLNRPFGDSFITHDKDSVKGVLLVDGKRIERQRGKGVPNSYRLDGKEFQAFGTSGVPQEITNLLNISYINFQQQFDSPWWFMKTPGEVSRELNQIINLSLIDSTLANIASDKRSAAESQKFIEERLEKAKKDKERLQWTQQAEGDLTDLEKKSNEKLKIVTELTELSYILERIEFYSNSIEMLYECVSVGLEAIQTAKQVLETSEQAEFLKNLLESISEAEKLTQIDVPSDQITILEKIKEKWKKVHVEKYELRELLQSIDKEESELCQLRKNLKEVKKDLEEQSQGICPICQRPLKTK